MQREPGFYWVKQVNGEAWEVMWTAGTVFEAIGGAYEFGHAELAVIGDRIPTPEEK